MFMYWLGAGLIAALLAAQPARQAAGPRQEETQSTCPYLRQKPHRTPTVDARTLEDDTLKQMAKLIKARKMYEEAEDFRKNGLVLDALQLYVEVQALCPGSRFDGMATDRLKEMGRAKAVVGLTPDGALTPALAVFLPLETFQEQESIGRTPEARPIAPPSDVSCPYLRDQQPHKKDRPIAPSAIEEDTLKQMTKLLKARELYDAAEAARARGAIEEAEHAYRQVRALSPETRLDTMATKRLKEIEESRPVAGIGSLPLEVDVLSAPERDGSEASEPPAEEEQALVPHLPAIDPKIVDALEKALAGCSEPLPAKLVILEATENDAEEEEALPDQWNGGTPSVEFPSLLLESENPASDAQVEEEKEEDVRGFERADLNSLLREVIDAVREGACIDLDSGGEDLLRAQIEMRVGDVELKLVRDESGIHCAIVQLLPEACSDLRARQRALNDSVIDWISRWSGSGNYGTPEEKPDGSRFDLQDVDEEDAEMET